MLGDDSRKARFSHRGTDDPDQMWLRGRLQFSECVDGIGPSYTLHVVEVVAERHRDVVSSPPCYSCYSCYSRLRCPGQRTEE